MPEVTEAAAAAEQTPATTETAATTTETTEQTPVVETTETETQTSAAPEAAAREKLEANVRAKLAALNDDEDESDETADAAEEDAASLSAESSTSEPTKPKEAAAAVTPAAPTLPAAHIRSLKAYDWTDEEIADAAKDPRFAATAAKIHANRNKEITAWAEAGRKAKETAQQQPAAQQQPPAQQKLDIAALKQQYGDEPLIAKLEQQEQELAQFRTFRQQWETQAQQQHLENLSRQIDGFFGSKELESYRDVYGTTSATLTPAQSEKRAEVLRLADAIVGGARQSGHQLSLEQALQHAFDSVSAPIVKQAARQEITKQLQTRGKGVTLKPGARVTPKANTRVEMERNVKSKLKSVFG